MTIDRDIQWPRPFTIACAAAADDDYDDDDDDWTLQEDVCPCQRCIFEQLSLDIPAALQIFVLRFLLLLMASDQASLSHFLKRFPITFLSQSEI